MKKILLLITSILMFSCSCGLYNGAKDRFNDWVYSERASGHALYYSVEFEQIQTPYDIPFWIAQRIRYEKDPDGKDSWDNPEEVLRRGYGDCDDFAILVMNIAYVRFGIKFDLVLIDARTIYAGGTVNHATVACNGIIYNVYDLRYYIQDIEIGYLYTFDEVFDYTEIPSIQQF